MYEPLAESGFKDNSHYALGVKLLEAQEEIERLYGLKDTVCPSPADCTCSKPDLSDPYPLEGPNVRNQNAHDVLTRWLRRVDERLAAVERKADNPLIWRSEEPSKGPRWQTVTRALSERLDTLEGPVRTATEENEFRESMLASLPQAFRERLERMDARFRAIDNNVASIRRLSKSGCDLLSERLDTLEEERPKQRYQRHSHLEQDLAGLRLSLKTWGQI